MQRKLGVTLGVVDLVVTGADGRLGRLLRAAWSVRPPNGIRLIWASRRKGSDILWDLEEGPGPILPSGSVVLHLAGVVRGTDDELARNVAMMPALFAACRVSLVKRLIVASSAAVYEPGRLPADEDDLTNPISEYGRSKSRVEALALASNLPVTVLRFGNLVGADALFAPRDDRAEVVLDPVAETDGGPLRSWIGPITLADTLARLVALPTVPEVLNIACDPPLFMADLLRASGVAWRFGPSRNEVIPTAILSTEKLRKLVTMPEVTSFGLISELRQIGFL